MKNIITVVGARPNFMKAAPLHLAFRRYPSIQHRILHTGQHYDANMSKVFFKDLELPQPDIYLGVGSGSHAEQTAKVMVEFEKTVLAERPDLVIVVGDVNSTVACSLVCAKLGIPVAHVEAGLRSFDRTMPEEINRIVTDAVADLLFVSEGSGVKNLRREGIDSSKVFLVGNTMIDSLVRFRRKARRSTIRRDLGVSEKNYTLVTLHRPSNVDEQPVLSGLINALAETAAVQPVVFPVHPRTRKQLEEFSLFSRVRSTHQLIVTDPLGYLDFLSLLESASLVVTDSGGIQEETTYLGVPCLTMRDNTERPVTVTQGTNRLLGHRYDLIAAELKKTLSGKKKRHDIPRYWDGRAASRIARIIVKRILPH
ncbi:MAG TPA: UDP-N-acetylglucosamine 2-epimerase (non-hydrolyzing) [Bacteroidota bacterium]|nr:UDP-N-acetylglucosamine 2-epimerase (non-hydrolyzing) [Bacteroidota bacterium]